MKQANLDSVLLDFRVDAAGGPKPTVLEAYCKKYPRYARELTDYAVQWLIGDAMAATEAGRDVVHNASSPLVSKAISRFYNRISERDSAKEAAPQLSGTQAVNPFEELPLPRMRAIRDELGINTPLFGKFRNRLIDPDTVPPGFLERFARLLERTMDEFLGYLRLPPTVPAGADFKADRKPSVSSRKESFADAVGGSSLDEKQKLALLEG